MKKALLITLLMACSHFVHARFYFTRVYSHDTSWTSGYMLGLCSPVQRTADGGYLLGSTIRRPSFDYYDEVSYMIKTDANFDPQWSKQKSGNEVYSLASGSLIYAAGLIGFDTSAVCSFGITVEKFNLNGTPVFTERFCSDSFDLHIGPSVMPDAHLRIAGGYSTSKALDGAFMATIDTNGTLLHADTFCVNGMPGISTVINLFGDTSGNAYPVFGYSSSNRYVIAKIRANGTIAWSQLITESYDYELSCMIALPNGDVIYGMSTIDWHDWFTGTILVKFSSVGDLIWQRRINGLTRVNGMKLLQSGNILMASAGNTFGTLHTDHPMLEIDTAANVLNAKDISPDTAARPHYTGVSVPYESLEGDLYFSCVTKDTFSTVVFNTDRSGVGACIAVDTFFTTADTTFFTITPATLAYGPIPMSTTIQPNNDTAIQYPTYTDICGGIIEKVKKVSSFVKSGIMPNPATSYINIINAAAVQKLDIYDMAGRLVMAVHDNNIDKEINVSSLHNGTYLVRLYSKDGSVSNYKLIVLH